ncbi:MAG: hypothetical protein SGPRY_014280, partial [Prymnesium sp.]
MAIFCLIRKVVCRAVCYCTPPSPRGMLQALAPLLLATLEDCLGPSLGPTTPLLLPSSPGFSAASSCLNIRYDLLSSPDVVVRAQSVADVQAVVVCAAQFNREISVRSGAHSFENHSCRGRVLLDISDLTDYSYDPETQMATWESGHTNGQVYFKLTNDNRTLPLGQEGDVGTGGLTLGCGRGSLTQYLGRICDRLQEVEYVDYQGNVKVANSQQNTDMLWMARGGGGEFPGVVTKFTALTGPEPVTVNTRNCDRGDVQVTGKAVIREWAKGLEETSQSERQMFSYIHLFPNLGEIWMRFFCFDCNATQLEWFESKTDEIASLAGGFCAPISDHAPDMKPGSHPKQFLNFLANEPGVGDWNTLPLKPHYWPGENQGLFAESGTAGAYYINSYEVDEGLLDALWPIMFNNPPASTLGSFAQQFYFYPIESNGMAPADSVGQAFNGMSAKWLIHFKTADGDWSDQERLFHTHQISSALAAYLPCSGFYNYIESNMVCVNTREEILAAYFSDPQRLQQIKAEQDPDGVFRGPLLSWTQPPPPSPPVGPLPRPPPLAPITCETSLDNDAGGVSCGARINFLISTQGLSEVVARQTVADEYPEECGACSQPPMLPMPPDVDADGFTCGARIAFLVSTGQTQAEAEQQVASEFSEQCGP